VLLAFGGKMSFLGLVGDILTLEPSLSALSIVSNRNITITGCDKAQYQIAYVPCVAKFPIFSAAKGPQTP